MISKWTAELKSAHELFSSTRPVSLVGGVIAATELVSAHVIAMEHLTNYEVDRSAYRTAALKGSPSPSRVLMKGSESLVWLVL